MKKIVFLFLLLVFSIWLGIKIHNDPGYILISYQDWSLETTLWFGLLAILIIYFCLFFIFKLLNNTVSIPKRIRSWLERRREEKANRVSLKGLAELVEGDWKEAEKNLLKGTYKNNFSLINYLAAAKAAQKQNHFEDRDNYLRLAYQNAPSAKTAIGITQAQLQSEANQLESALATLEHLYQEDPKHIYILSLLKDIYLQLKDWLKLKNILPALKKHKILNSTEIEELEKKANYQLLKSAADANDFDQLTLIWETLPRHFQYAPEMLIIYIDQLLKNHQDSKAEVLLRESVKKNWDSQLVFRFSQLKSEHPDKLLAFVESFLKSHANDSLLLLCLGKLCIQNQLWGKAKDYLLASIAVEPSVAAFFELGQLYEKLDEPQEALLCYKKGVSLK